jgi:hypothetical protein
MARVGPAIAGAGDDTNKTPPVRAADFAAAVAVTITMPGPHNEDSSSRDHHIIIAVFII